VRFTHITEPLTNPSTLFAWEQPPLCEQQFNPAEYEVRLLQRTLNGLICGKCSAGICIERVETPSACVKGLHLLCTTNRQCKGRSPRDSWQSTNGRETHEIKRGELNAEKSLTGLHTRRRRHRLPVDSWYSNSPEIERSLTERGGSISHADHSQREMLEGLLRTLCPQSFARHFTQCTNFLELELDRSKGGK